MSFCDHWMSVVHHVSSIVNGLSSTIASKDISMDFEYKLIWPWGQKWPCFGGHCGLYRESKKVVIFLHYSFYEAVENSS